MPENTDADRPSSVKYPIVGVGAVVLRDNSILLIKRAKEPYKGQWSIPGGKVKWGESLQQAAEREILEETGIVIKAKQPVYTFEIITQQESQQHYIVIDLFADYISGTPLANDDASDALWIKLNEIENFDINEETLNLISSL